MNDTSPSSDATYDMSDYPQSPGLSEDSLSDSDWLDIASNRESDDNESVSSRDSDHNEVVIPLSRRSSMSIGSSRDGEVDAWEGFVDDSSDEGHSNEFESTGAVADGLFMGPLLDLEGEEQRVREALDQSMISTLGASRSSSHPSTVHSSLRDLKLSFPDPLTSSHEQLSGSYDNVSSSNHELPSLEGEEAITEVTVNDSSPVTDPGLLPTPESPTDTRDIDFGDVEYDIFLYGTSSSVKWTVVHDLLRKASLGAGIRLASIEHMALGTAQLLHFSIADSTDIFKSVAVYDRTGQDSPSSEISSNRPSLGIIYLPCTPFSFLPVHTFHLPVAAPLPGEDGVDLDALDRAESAWSELRIPAEKVLHVQKGLRSPVLCMEEISRLHAVDVYNGIRQITAKKRPGKGLSEHFTSVHAVTFFALLSLIVGFTVNTALSSSVTTPTPTARTHIPTPFWNVFTNQSSSLSLRSSTSIAVVPQSASLSLYNRGSTAISASSSPSAGRVAQTADSTPANSPKDPSDDCDCKPLSWSERMGLSKDVVIRSPAPVARPIVAPKELSKSAESFTSLSIRAVDSLSHILDSTMRALIEVVQHDLKELMEAIDELSRAIRRQTDTIFYKSRSTSQVVREAVKHRHERAKDKAKELKEIGGQLISYAGNSLIGRTRVARQKAHQLKENMWTSETWRMYQKAHGHWKSTLTQGTEAQEKEEGRRTLFGRS
ncbi:uncharacterized protein EV420DRAFT_1496579 [Desarmillaria tabescens]|uniref:Uncharacterized protein n=1 Tax=Armillaria tabescens TaxID=1929756 RepID=A0AA39NQ74_ARMTA|nr:uncharacterized protein EV420DRAFT_1496579 [Desarmillaria tabescens]KAK0469795.1 hypothetical protein EV420DRAFT_1496579 [Desarmillaria tabescens]